MDKKIKYATIIPLIGGMTVANKAATGNDPEFIVSYAPFAKNDSHAAQYFDKTPYHVIPDSGEDEVSPSLRSSYYEQLDFVSTVCPCAGLSMLNNASGTSSARGSDAAQNDWMYKSAQWVFENLRPKVFWGENAPGLYTTIGDGVRDKLKRMAAEHGYSFSIVKTDTYIHGIPQHRRRTFYFFWRDTNAPLLDWHERSVDALNLPEYLNLIPADAPYQDRFFTRSHPVSEWKLYEYVLEKTGLTDTEFRKNYIGALYHYISKQGWIDDAIKWMDERYPGWTGEERTKLDHIKRKLADGKGYWDSSPFFVHDYVNAIIGKNMHVLVHPTEDRFLNIRECLWLMGLPHDFTLTKENEVWNHLAQNVPVKTATDWTHQVIKYINGGLRDSGHSHIMQDNLTQKITHAEQHTVEKPKYKTVPVI